MGTGPAALLAGIALLLTSSTPVTPAQADPTPPGPAGIGPAGVGAAGVGAAAVHAVVGRHGGECPEDAGGTRAGAADVPADTAARWTEPAHRERFCGLPVDLRLSARGQVRALDSDRVLRQKVMEVRSDRRRPPPGRHQEDDGPHCAARRAVPGP
ncbi:hypothetical protein [Saccharothrix algeriensis]|uniref:Secreted protein n=1 Tax=Saccharothrix algeriensis TaxID=173560 RepID=A0ABS2SFU7_9PSEU|nr:hypothetical protein [Saccharothrix algeriensis]MBM7814849.1 hypothetical protein [Saccharothrix algeriensis]